jgi:hypothetical protein
MKFFGYRSRSDAVAAEHSHEHPTQGDIKEAYDRGRRDERSRHRRSPLLTLAVVAVALVGAILIGLAVREGSFSRAGQVADQQLGVAADQASVASRDAAAATGEAVRDAGDTLRNRNDAG